MHTVSLSLRLNRSSSQEHTPSKTLAPPKNGVRRLVFTVVQSRPFEYCIICVILLNVLEMACDYYGIEHHPLHYALFVGANLFFSWVYYIEAALKLVGLGPRQYFGDSWCRFDFVLVCISLLDQYAGALLMLLPLPPTTLRVFRIFRILRVLRLLKTKRAKGIRDLLMTMVRLRALRIRPLPRDPVARPAVWFGSSPH